MTVGLAPGRRPRPGVLDDLDAAVDAAGQMAADLALLDAVAAGGAARAAPLPLGAAGAVARPLPARRRRRPRRVRAARRRGGPPPDRRPGAPARRRPHLRGRHAPPAGRRRHVDAVYRGSPAALIAGLGSPRGRRGDRPPRGRAGPVCFAGPGRRPAGGGPQALRLGPGAAGRRGPPARLDPPRPPPLRRARPPPARDRDRRQVTRTRLRASDGHARRAGAPTDPRGRRGALVAGFASTLDLTFDLEGQSNSSDVEWRRAPRRAVTVSTPVRRPGYRSAMRCRRCGHRNEPGRGSARRAERAAARTKTTLSLTELAERRELDAELGAALADLPDGMGMLVVAAGPERGQHATWSTATSPRSAATPTPTSSSTTSPSPAATRSSSARATAASRSRDVGSLNGTYVNHDRVDYEPLHHGDEIQVGRFVLIFRVGART